MSFVMKEWLPRLVEFAGRRKLTNVSTSEITYADVERSEGTVSQEGDAFSPTNMNGLEQRIADAFDEVNQSLQPSIIKGENITMNQLGYNTEGAVILFTPNFSGHVILSVTGTPYDYWTDGKEYQIYAYTENNYVNMSNKTSSITQNYTNICFPYHCVNGVPFYINAKHFAQSTSITFKFSYRMLVINRE